MSYWPLLFEAVVAVAGDSDGGDDVTTTTMSVHCSWVLYSTTAESSCSACKRTIASASSKFVSLLISIKITIIINILK